MLNCSLWFQFDTTLDTNNFSIFVPSTKVYVSHGRRRITRSKLRFPLDRNLPYLSHKDPGLWVSSHLLQISFASQQYVNMLFKRPFSPFDLLLNKHYSPVRPASRIVLTQLL